MAAIFRQPAEYVLFINVSKDSVLGDFAENKRVSTTVTLTALSLLRK